MKTRKEILEYLIKKDVITLFGKPYKTKDPYMTYKDGEPHLYVALFYRSKINANGEKRGGVGVEVEYLNELCKLEQRRHKLSKI